MSVLDPEKIWFTSDTHFHHKNVIEYCNRPFGDVREMNETMIKNWNQCVQPSDLVIHLGDFAMGPRELVAPILARLNGRKYLIRGNHDRGHNFMKEAGFERTFNSWLQKFGDPREKGEMLHIFMQHHPNEARSVNLYGDFHLCGHVHNEWARKGLMFNVGVDVRNFTPVSLLELLESRNVGN